MNASVELIQSLYQKFWKNKLNSKKIIEVAGWVRSIRNQGNITFITLNDGSTIKNLQLVLTQQEGLNQDYKKISNASSLLVCGKIFFTPEHAQPFELREVKIKKKNLTKEHYPLQKKKIPLEIIRKHAHLRAKTGFFLVIFRLRHYINESIHKFFSKNNFYNIPSPIITNNDTEGGGETFDIVNKKKKNEVFFTNKKKVKLTVSGQLQLEALCQGLGRVYSFNPCFRAENSHTTRHLAEFWMVEAEIANASLNSTLNIVEKLIKFVIQKLLKNNLSELKFLEEYNNKPIVSRLEDIKDHKFKRISYTQAIRLLYQKKQLSNLDHQVNWGINLQSEHERYLCQYLGNRPIFITNYPAELKAFYFKQKTNNSSKKIKISFDLLTTEEGEIAGGGTREDDYFALKKRISETYRNSSNINWYLELRKYGYAPTAGFGIGIERLIMFLTGIENICDISPFPRVQGKLDY